MRIDIKNMFGDHAVALFTDDVISLFSAEQLPSSLELNDSTAKLYHYLKVSKPKSIFS